MKVKQYQKASFLLMVMLFCISLVSAQTTITGTISNQDYEPIIGANIIIKGTAAGTASDLDGKFSLTSKQALPWDLVFSYTGYKSKTVSVTKANQLISVVLELGTSLDEIIISASRKAEKIQDAPASVSVVTAKEIQNKTVANPISLLDNTVGVSIDKQGGLRTNITMRGASDLLATSTYVLMDYRSLIGAGLNTFDAGATTLNTLDIDRLEVIRGPGSALYGPGVTAGVVHFLTKDPFKYPGTSIQLDAGNLNTLKSSFRHAGHNEDKTFGYKVTAFTVNAEEWGLDPNDETDAATIATFQDVIIDPIDGSQATTTGGVLDEKGKSIGGTASLYFRPKSGVNIVTTAGINKQDGLYWSSQGEGYQAATDFYVQGRVSYKGLFGQVYYNTNKAPSDIADKGFLYRSGQLSVVDRKQFETQLQYNFDIESINTNITVGGDYRTANLDSQTRTFGRNEDIDDYDIYGGYLQAKTNLTDKLDMVLAARYDGFSAIDESAFSPRVAFVYKASPNHTFRASYNKAFAPNSALDIYADFATENSGAFDQWLVGNNTAQTFNNPSTTFLNGLPTSEGIGIGVGDAYNAFTPAAIQTISAIPAFQGVLPFLLPILQSPAFATSISSIGGFSDGIPIDGAGNLLLPEGTPAASLREDSTIEIGYKGVFADKFTVNLDVYQVNKKNFTAVRQISPLVVLPTVGADVNAALSPALTSAFSAAFSAFLQSPGGGGLDQATADFFAAQTAANVVPGVTAVYDGVANAFFNNPDGSPGVRGIVQTDQVPDGGLPHLALGYRNFGDLTYYGVDFGVNYLATDNLRLFGNYSWVNENSFDAKDLGEPEGSTDTYNLNFSQHKLRFGANYEPEFGFITGASVKHNSEFEANLGTVYSGTVEARTLVDANVGYNMKNGLFFNLSAENIFNKKYRAFPVMPEIGTRVLATVRYTFGGKK